MSNLSDDVTDKMINEQLENAEAATLEVIKTAKITESVNIVGQSYHVRVHDSYGHNGIKMIMWQVLGDRDGRIYAESAFSDIACFIANQLTIRSQETKGH